MDNLSQVSDLRKFGRNVLLPAHAELQLSDMPTTRPSDFPEGLRARNNSHLLVTSAGPDARRKSTAISC